MIKDSAPVGKRPLRIAYEPVPRIALTFPNVEEGNSYGTPASKPERKTLRPMLVRFPKVRLNALHELLRIACRAALLAVRHRIAISSKKHFRAK